jgi:hypothetical protein
MNKDEAGGVIDTDAKTKVQREITAPVPLCPPPSHMGWPRFEPSSPW